MTQNIKENHIHNHTEKTQVIRIIDESLHPFNDSSLSICFQTTMERKSVIYTDKYWKVYWNDVTYSTVKKRKKQLLLRRRNNEKKTPSDTQNK